MGKLVVLKWIYHSIYVQQACLFFCMITAEGYSQQQCSLHSDGSETSHCQNTITQWGGFLHQHWMCWWGNRVSFFPSLRGWRKEICIIYGLPKGPLHTGAFLLHFYLAKKRKKKYFPLNFMKCFTSVRCGCRAFWKVLHLWCTFQKRTKNASPHWN